MSFDLAVWNGQSNISERNAARIYKALCRGETPNELRSNSSVSAFYRELIERWPEIDSVPEEQVDDTDICPWSSALVHSDSYVLLACVWSKAQDVYGFVQDLARRHHLVFYDPQAGEAQFP